MAEVVDLRQFRCSQLEPLLQAETAEWSRRLDWDYASSADLIRQYIEARILPGYVLAARGRGRNLVALGYGFFIYESRKGMIGNLFVLPEHRDPEHEAEHRLLLHMVDTLRGTPGLERIEAQLMPFAPEALAGSFALHGFQSFRRVFLALELHSPPPRRSPPPLPEVTHYHNLRLEPWGGATYEEAARLIQHAYERHVDSCINDQYRSFAGAVRFMHNIAHYPGCGAFDATASFIARSVPEASLEGMILTSRVKPDVAHITQICVQPERQRRGLGRALLGRCLEQLRRQGMRAATLTVTSENRSARALYAQLGFTAMAEFDAYVWDRTERYEELPL
ncbi:MAG: GNAT family N-acetyltransferase [Terriglobales bacterium]